VNLVVADLPSGWLDGHAPWGRVATAQANAALAGCLGLAPADVGILTGTPQSSAQPEVSSGWVNSSQGSSEGFESAVALLATVPDEVSALSKLTSVSAASCLQGWFASLDVAQDQIVDAPQLTAIHVTAVAGERCVGFRLKIVTRSGNTQASVQEDLIVLGAGRVEVVLLGEAVGAQINSATESSVLSGVEQRLQIVARS
jgi:hypothetical protein